MATSEAEDRPAARPRWKVIAGVLAGYLLVVLLLAAHRGLPAGPWAVHSDAGVWLGMRRTACDGGRLYADAWSNKGPLLHLLISPLCLAPNAGDLTVGRDVTLALVPMLAFGAAACALAGAVLLNGAFAGVIFGAAGALVFWTSTVRDFFVSELLAAPFALAALTLWIANRRQPRGWHSAALAAAVAAGALINLKFVAYGALYPFLRGLSPRRLLRDALVSAALSAAVLVAVLGFDVESYRWFLKTLDTSSYGTPGLAEQVRAAAEEHWFGRSRGLIAFFDRAFSPLLSRRGAWLAAVLAHLAVVLPLAHLLRRQPRLLLPFLAVWLASVSALLSGHAFFQLAPFLLLGTAGALGERGARGRVVAGLVALCVLALLVFELRERSSRYLQAGRPAAILRARDEARRYRERLGDRRWLSLLGNGYPPLLAAGVPRPVNRFFHNYANQFPPWAEDQARRALEEGGIRVALHPSLAEEGSRVREIIDEVRRRCVLVAAEDDGLGSFRRTEYRDCPKRAP